jgi:Glycosyl hydrolase family 115/Gylcosyl hydrolase family 115 C-terminal domain/Viral BACON domain
MAGTIFTNVLSQRFGHYRCGQFRCTKLHQIAARCVKNIFNCCLFFTFAISALALGETHYIENRASPGSFLIANDSTVATLFVDTNDFPGVVRAVHDLQADIARVIGRDPLLKSARSSIGTNAIIIGTIGKSPIIDELVSTRKIDVSQISGKWESFLIQVVPKPFGDVQNALIIAGGDKRGTIYGVYDLSEQIGVSPWYWWADVPVAHKSSLYAKTGRIIEGQPAVKYRGIFLNDEAPCLTGWVNEKFGNYNHRFYTNVFELLLRLKANYLWPAMWNNCFNEDDPLNPKLADEYGIVMGTSHVEPMLRADKEWNRKGHNAAEWNYDKNPEILRTFWEDGIERNKDYESIITIAMRGKIDTPMSESANIALLERIVADQRQIIARRMNPDVTKVPQLWALYKEVQEYYEKGMRVPDDVTLLWCDDNWGNIRRLPTPEERKRSGGAGIYYHFDYVGGPRNYKWLNTTPISKVWEQMNMAYQYGADRIWIVNVGDLKPLEFPMEFFLRFAWAPNRWPKEKISEYTRLWAEREFGPAHANEIADLLAKYTKFNGRRKPELLEPETFSLINYREADTVLADWKSIAAKAEKISAALPEGYRPAFYELILHPIKACEIVNELYITVGKNRLYAEQGRASANDLAAHARALFKADQDQSDYYNHTLLNGKWNHMMDQTHIGYTYWQQPPKNSMPKVNEIQVPEPAEMGIAIEGSRFAWPGSTNEPVLPIFDSFNQPRRLIDVFNKGRIPFDFTVNASVPWLTVTPTKGTVDRACEVSVAVDWSTAPRGTTNAFLKVARTGADPISIRVDLFNPESPTRDSLKGFVECDGYVSIEASHYTKKHDAAQARWEKIGDLGLTGSSMSVSPVTSESVTPPENSPCLEYQMYLFNSGSPEVSASISPALNIAPNRGLRFAVSFDDQTPQILTAVPKGFFVDNGNTNWEASVRDNCRQIKSTHTIENPGYHTLKIWMVDPGIVLEKLVVNTGGVKHSYLGPPESYHSPGLGAEQN